MEAGGFKKDYKILALSQIGGATKYKSDDNLIGLAHYLKNLSSDSKPDFVAILGGALPDIPKKGSRGNFNRLIVVERGVANIDDAAAVIKPHLERILKELPRSTEVVYVFGREDLENIKHLEDSLMYDYNYNPEGIANRIRVVQESISSRKEIIRSTIESRKALKSQLKSASNEEKAKLLEELENIEVKISVNKEEISELEVRGVLLSELYSNAIMKTDQKSVELALKNARSRLKELKQKLKELKEQGESAVEEYNRLKREAKWVSGKIRALNHRLNESAENATKESLSKKKAQALIFTKQIPISKSAADLIHEIAVEHYKSTIKDAFGRKRGVILQIERIASYKVGDFYVVLENPRDLYTQKATSDEGSMLYKSIENGMLSNVGKNVILIRGHNLYTTFKLKPLFNNTDSMLAVLNQGLFIDLEKRAMLYNLGITTNETKAVDKSLLGSGASLIVVHDGSPKFQYLDSQFFKMERLKSDMEERQKLEELMRIFEAGDVEKEKNGNGAFKPELQRAIISNKRPSEIKERELAYADKGLLLSLLRSAENVEEPETIRIVSIQDLHIGNYSNLPIFKASLRDIIEKKPDILLFLGDIFEGNLNNYKYVPRQSNMIDDAEKFEEYLIKEVGVEKAREVMLQYYKEKEKYSMHNIDEQVGLFVRPMLPIIKDIIKRNGYLLIASGNHYNNTENGWQFDEATKLKDYIVTALATAGEDLPAGWEKHIKVAPGSEYGAGSFFISHNGVDYEIEVAHELPKNAKLSSTFIKERTDAKLFYCGHYHEPEAVVFNGKVVIYGASMQKSADNPFLKRIKVPVSRSDLFNGYTYSEIMLGSGKVVAANVENILKQDLRQKMEELEAKKEELYTLYRHEENTIKLSREKQEGGKENEKEKAKVN
ncbi:MAG: hypothetical protein ACPLYE_02925 [Candidatus Micrarchaeales archaeon]